MTFYRLTVSKPPLTRAITTTTKQDKMQNTGITREEVVKLIEQIEPEIPDQAIQDIFNSHVKNGGGNIVFDTIRDRVSSLSSDIIMRSENRTKETFTRVIGETEVKLRDELAAQSTNTSKVIKDAISKAVAKMPVPKADAAEVKRLADEAARTILADCVKKNAPKGTKVMLPPVRQVDPFYLPVNTPENNASDRAEYAILSGRHCIASGPSGAGKTFPFEQEMRKAGLRYFKVSVADGLKVSDLTVKPAVRANEKGIAETLWVYGVLVLAMQNGCGLLLDEIDQAQPEVCSVLNSVMEYGELFIPETGETITAAPGFILFMTCNTLRDSTGTYSGFRMSAALLNRLTFAKADYLKPEDEMGILLKTGASKKECGQVVALFAALRKAYLGGAISHAPSTRIGVRVCQMVAGVNDKGVSIGRTLDLIDALKMALFDGMQDIEMEVVKPLLQSVGLK